MTYKMTRFERFIAKPAHSLAICLGKALGTVAKMVGMK